MGRYWRGFYEGSNFTSHYARDTDCINTAAEKRHAAAAPPAFETYIRPTRLGAGGGGRGDGRRGGMAAETTSPLKYLRSPRMDEYNCLQILNCKNRDPLKKTAPLASPIAPFGGEGPPTPPKAPLDQSRPRSAATQLRRYHTPALEVPMVPYRIPPPGKDGRYRGRKLKRLVAALERPPTPPVDSAPTPPPSVELDFEHQQLSFSFAVELAAHEVECMRATLAFADRCVGEELKLLEEKIARTFPRPPLEEKIARPFPHASPRPRTAGGGSAFGVGAAPPSPEMRALQAAVHLIGASPRHGGADGVAAAGSVVAERPATLDHHIVGSMRDGGDGNDSPRTAPTESTHVKTRSRIGSDVHDVKFAGLYSSERRFRVVDILRQLDTNGDGVVSPQELRAELSAAGMEDQEIRALFTSADRNGDGFLDVKDLKTLLGALGGDGSPSPHVSPSTLGSLSPLGRGASGGGMTGGGVTASGAAQMATPDAAGLAVPSVVEFGSMKVAEEVSSSDEDSF